MVRNKFNTLTKTHECRLEKLADSDLKSFESEDYDSMNHMWLRMLTSSPVFSILDCSEIIIDLNFWQFETVSDIYRALTNQLPLISACFPTSSVQVWFALKAAVQKPNCIEQTARNSHDATSCESQAKPSCRLKLTKGSARIRIRSEK